MKEIEIILSEKSNVSEALNLFSKVIRDLRKNEIWDEHE